MLKNITLASPKAEANTNGLRYARERLLENLGVQLKIAEAFAKGTTYIHRRKQKVDNGQGVMVEKELPVQIRPWLFQDSDKKWYAEVRYQNRRLPLSEKAPVALVGDVKQAPAVVEALIAAVRAGELDDLLRDALARKAGKQEGEAKPKA